MARTRSRIPPRLLTRDDLRAYLGDLSWEVVQTRMKAGRLPGPIWAVQPDDPVARWDLKAVDRALDDASGVPGSVEDGVALLDRALGFR